MFSNPRRSVKEFTHTWKIEQLHSSLSHETQLWSPKTYVSERNWIKFGLDSRGTNSVSGMIRLAIEKSRNLDVSLVDCDLTLDGIPGTTFGFFKIRCPDIPGWRFHYDNDLERVKNGCFEFCVSLFVGEPIVQQSAINDIELRKLSRDIGRLLKSTEFSDVTLKTMNGDFRTHKSILAARCPELLRILSIDELEASPTSRVVYTISPQVFRILLDYWYLGKIDVNRTDLPVGLTNAVETLKLEDLKSKICAYPTSLNTVTWVRTSTHTVTWPIKDFSKSLPKKIFTSPVFQSSHLGSLQLMLLLQSSADSSDVHVSVRLHPDVTTSRCSIRLKTAVVNVFEEQTHVKSFLMDPNLEWNEALIIKNEELDDMLQEDTLAFYVEVIIRNLIHEVNENLYSLDYQASSSHDLSNLSDNLRNLYASGKFSDWTVDVRGKKFKVHKAILSVRAPKLFSVLKDKRGFAHNACIFGEEEPDVMESLLTYIYSARVDVVDSGQATKLYLVADKYDFGLLKKSCLAFIKSNITF